MSWPTVNINVNMPNTLEYDMKYVYFSWLFSCVHFVLSFTGGDCSCFETPLFALFFIFIILFCQHFVKMYILGLSVSCYIGLLRNDFKLKFNVLYFFLTA